MSYHKPGTGKFIARYLRLLLDHPYLISSLSFFRKEFFGALRQPRLIMSLVAGPFIILAIFGVGYYGPGNYSTILVVPDRAGVSTNLADYKEVVKQTFRLVKITKDEKEAREELAQGEVQVVIVVPANALTRIYNGSQAVFPIYYHSLNPVDSGYIEYSSYAYSSEFNQVILRQALGASKPQSGQLQESSRQIATGVDALDHSMRTGNLVEAKAQVEGMRVLVQVTRRGLDSLILPGQGPADSTQHKLLTDQLVDLIFVSGINQIRADLDNIEAQLNALDAGFDRGDLNSLDQRAHLESIRASNARIGERADKIAAIPPAVLVSPVVAAAHNQLPTEVNYINFYGPAVVMLLLQHIAITLASLSNVRERQLGSIEVYRVSPLSPAQILTGKFISLGSLLLVLGVVLIGLITLVLRVPFIGFPDLGLMTLAVLLLTIYSSIGLGYIVAALANTESQAVQFSMLFLLASIFFTGFILPLNQFAGYVKYFGYILPVTSGASGLQRVMLDTQSVNPGSLILPFIIGTVYLGVGYFLYRRRFKLG